MGELDPRTLMLLWLDPQSAIQATSDRQTLVQVGDLLLGVGRVEDTLLAYRKALENLSWADAPGEYARTVAKLSNALLRRQEGDRSQSVEEAIAVCREALQRIAPNELADVLYFHAVRVTISVAGPPEGRADLFDQLAAGYMYRLEGDRAENIEIAFRACHQALADTDRDADPVNWAAEANRMASVLLRRLKGDPQENLRHAIEHLEEAVGIFARQGDAQRWMSAATNLATDLLIVTGDERSASWRRAVGLYADVLKLRPRATDPIGWASTMLGLARAYLDPPEVEGTEGTGKAAELYKEVLSEPALERAPEYRAEALLNLGIAYQTTGEVKQAAKAFRDALAALPPGIHPRERADALRRLANLYFDEGLWAKAEPLFAEAIAVQTRLLETAVYEAGRRAHTPSDLHPRYAYCLLRRGKHAEALDELEAGKARLLALAVALTAARLEALDPELREAIVRQRELIRSLERSRADEQARDRFQTRLEDSWFVAALEQAREELARLLAQAREQRPGVDLDTLSISDILALAPEEGALVAPLFTSKGSAVFVVPYGTTSITARHVLRLDDFTTASLNTLLEQAARASAPSLEAVTETLWEQLGRRILGRLRRIKARRVLFLAQGGLGLLPVHAARRDERGRARYLADDVEITYAPSAYALDTARRHAAQQRDHAALVMGVSRSERLGDLQSIEPEVRAVAELLGTEPLLDADAKVGVLLDRAPTASYLHLACHGAFGWGTDPLASALYLAGDATLSLEDIIGRVELTSTRLVTLSACESGTVEAREAPDEFFGLTAGFMQAGAIGVLSSLWRVDDLSTALLMERFYRNHLEHAMAPSAALREAQQWLRGLTRGWVSRYLLQQGRKAESRDVLLRGPSGKPLYASPYYWAAFTYNGV